jgi:transcriptional regulator of arginine metabolism
MARSARQSKILELITTREIETQEELVDLLRKEEFNITQATISRDIKELGLIKILTDDKKYKYAYVETNEQAISNKYVNIFKEAIILVRTMNNSIVLKTLKGVASAINSFLDKLGLDGIVGSVNGDDCVIIYFDDETKLQSSLKLINTILFE